MTQCKPTRRQLIGSALGLLGVGTVSRVASSFDAAGVEAAHAGVSEAAEVASAAVRLSATTTTSTTTTTLPPATPPGAGQLLYPVDPAVETYVLNNYGACRGDRPHRGVDILQAPRGTAVYAVQRGALIDWFQNEGPAGWGWTLLGDDGYRYRYMHLDALEPTLAARFADVANGVAGAVPPRVERGQLLGGVGSTGNDSVDNIHLHFEVRPTSSTWTDPLPLLALPSTATVSAPLKDCLALL